MKEIRKIIKEELGIQLDVQKIAIYASQHAVTFLNLKKNEIPGIRPINTGFSFDLSEELSNSINIETIKVISEIDIVENPKENKVGGTFKSSETKLNSNNKFIVSIDVKLFLTKEEFNSIESFISNIESVISHELNHAFVFVKKYGKNSKTQVYNSVKSMLGFEFQKIPALKEFIEMFYLNLPEEIQARVQETGIILKSIEADNYQEVIKELYRYQPINDAKRMVQYKIDRLESLTPEVLKKFVETFNRNIDLFNKNTNIKKITNVDKFFEYWVGHIVSNGYSLNKKILKLVADKFNKSEKEYMQEMHDYGMLSEIFGE